LFIEDLNMASSTPDSDETSPLELIREYLEQGGWYSKINPRFNYLS
jgi:hypothetical protein